MLYWKFPYTVVWLSPIKYCLNSQYHQNLIILASPADSIKRLMFIIISGARGVFGALKICTEAGVVLSNLSQ